MKGQKKVFKCVYCGFKFKKQIFLASHIKKRHLNSIYRIHKCLIQKCNLKFGSIASCYCHSHSHWRQLVKDYHKLPTHCKIHCIKNCHCMIKQYIDFFTKLQLSIEFQRNRLFSMTCNNFKKAKNEWHCVYDNKFFDTLEELHYHLEHNCIKTYFYYNRCETYLSTNNCDCMEKMFKRYFIKKHNFIF